MIIISSFEFTSAKVTKTPLQNSKSLSIKEIPRKDLYEQIKRTTGVSLRQLFHLVFQRGSAKNRQSTFTKLSKYVNKKETQQLIGEEYQQKMESIKAYCDKNQKATGCYSQVGDLKKEQSNLKKLKDKAKKDKILATYYYLTILTQSIKTEIFKKANMDLAKGCPMNKINTDLCMKKRRGIRSLYDIADKLKFVARAQTRGKAKKADKNTKKIAKHIDELITAYE